MSRVMSSCCSTGAMGYLRPLAQLKRTTRSSSLMRPFSRRQPLPLLPAREANRPALPSGRARGGWRRRQSPWRSRRMRDVHRDWNIADGNGHPDACRDGVSILPGFGMCATALGGAHDTGTACGLDSDHARQLTGDPAELAKLMEGLSHADQPGAAPGGRR